MKLYTTPPSILTLVTWVPQSKLAFGQTPHVGWPSGLRPLAITILQCSVQPRLPLAATRVYESLFRQSPARGGGSSLLYQTNLHSTLLPSTLLNSHSLYSIASRLYQTPLLYTRLPFILLDSHWLYQTTLLESLPLFQSPFTLLTSPPFYQTPLQYSRLP